MNKKNLESKEIRLGLIHVAGLLGLTVGCIAAAFCLGYLAGSKVGFERESATILAELPKFPVANEGTDELGEKIANEVYAKLNEAEKVEPTAEVGGAAAPDTLPELASIPDIPEQNLQPDVDQPPPIEAEPSSIGDSAKPDDKGTSAVKVLGELQGGASEPEGGEQQAIGSLLEKKEGTPAVVATKPTAVPTVSAVFTVAKEAAKIQATTNEAIPVTNKVPPGWFAQVAAPKRPEDANQLAQNLRKSGFAVTIESAQVRGEDYYRVLVGPESSKNQAQVLLQQLKKETYIKGEPFIRVVK